MTTGSGLYLSQVEQDKVKQNIAIRQLIEGRSNAVGITALRNTPNSSTVVKAFNCSPSSAVFLFPASSDAAVSLSAMMPYVAQADVVAGQFTIRHQVSSGGSAMLFWWVCLG
jgi:hypothetical protein